MDSSAPNVRVDTRQEKLATVVIEVPLEEGDADDHVVLSKAWAILAERITIEKREHVEEVPPVEDAVPAAPGNSA